MIFSASEMVKSPVVTKISYTLLDIGEDMEVSLLNSEMEEVSNLVALDNSDACNKLRKLFEEGKTVIVTILSAMGKTKVFDCKEEQL